MKQDAATRKKIGDWLGKAVGRGKSASYLEGLWHDLTGFLYATDGTRVHGIDGMSDRSGQVRCPASSEVIEADVLPDLGAIVQGLIEDEYVFELNPRELYAAAFGLVAAAKAGGFSGATGHLHLRPERNRIDLTLRSTDDKDADDNGGVTLDAGVASTPDPGSCRNYRDIPIQLSRIVDALGGMIAFGGRPMLELTTGIASDSAVLLRMIPGDEMDVPAAAFALILPLREDAGIGWRQDWNSRIEGR